MRSICEPSWLGVKSAFVVPFVFATASAIVGKKVRAMIGRPLLNVNS